MSAFLLNHISVIMCPHGGMVNHIPTSGTSYRVDGQLPLLLGDSYLVAGCPYMNSYGGPCVRVNWLYGSSMMIIKGQPALTHTSPSICMSAAGVPYGPAIVTAIRSTQREPDELTVIDD